MERVHGTVAWYQQKIGYYDKQLWEQSVEQKVLKPQGIKQAPRRSVRPKTDLIDVDLVRGSTFVKAKPQVPWTYITIKTFSRVVLFPFHYRWWIQQTSFTFFLLLLVLYTMQIFTISVFINNVGEEIMQDEQCLSEVAIPCVLMVLLGLIHSQTVLTHLKPPLRDNKREMWRRKRSLSQNRGSNSTSAETCGTHSPTQASNPEPAPSSSQSRSNLKCSTGSRLPRERTKERKVRLKSAPRSLTRRGTTSDRDSESAYHTHEASDSIVDRTSSMEHDSNSSGRKRVKSVDFKKSKEDNPRKKKESQESDLPEDSDSTTDQNKLLKADAETNSKRNSQSISSDETEEASSTVKSVPNGDIMIGRVCDKVTVDISAVTTVTKICDEKKPCEISADGKIAKVCDEIIADTSAVTKVANISDDKVTAGNSADGRIAKVCDNGETNLIADKESRDASVDRKVVKVCDKVPNDASAELDQMPTVNLAKKIEFEGRSYLEENADIKTEIGENKDDNILKEGSAVNCDTKHNVKSTLVDPVKDSVVDIPEVKVPGSDSLSKNLHGTQCKTKTKVALNAISAKSCQEAETVSKNSVGANADAVVSVKFNKELVIQREITPNCSREGTPTHTQSDLVLQSKHKRGGSGKAKSKTDTDSESESDAETPKILPNVRRRKVTYSESTEGNGSVVRNRRQNSSLSLREPKSGMQRVSSSEGETEGQSSEYSRGSRRTIASSDEWGDHLQSDVDTSSESTSCGSSPAISENEEPKAESETDFTQGMTASNIHVLNILQPSTNGTSLHGTPDKVTCIIWERNECKKIELTAMDIGWAIIETVDKIPESSDYILIGLTFSIVMGLCPLLFSTFHSKDLPNVVSWDSLYVVTESLINNTWRLNLIHLNAALQRLCLSAFFFFMLSVADRTFKQRLLYAKHFCYLTSSRRARKFDMPHFRLNKVRNIRTWLSLRSYLKKRGPQRSVDVIVSAAFLLTLIMLILMCLQLLRDTETYLNYLCNWELLLWCMALGIYLLRFMTLGLRINKKYRNLSVLITEQINLYLQMEQKPHKKEELMVANNVLKLAESLLKELESPFKISGISANPFILNFTKVVVLSAFSGVLTELLGFKLKLYKIKLRA